MIACMLAGCSNRAVLTQRAMLSECWRLQHPYTHRICLFIIRLLYARARLIVSNSYAASNGLHKEFGIPRSRLAVIHNSVDLARIKRLALEEPGHPWLAPLRKSLILSVGSLTPRKDYPTILRALSIVRASRECKLIVLGEGSERKKLERLARELAIEDAVQFLGFDPNPFRWMSRARMLVSASLAEGCPNVIQQALACGTQVVATDCPGGSKEILEGGKWGRLVPIRDPRAMAEAIEQTFDDRNPPNGSQRAIEFKPSRNAKAYLHVLATVFNTKRS
jgi:glycosyltransferase involved in cell wall biosynthesis